MYASAISATTSFPFRAGELLRSYVLKKQTGIDISSSLATVIIERIADGLVMIMFVFLALPFAPMPEFFRNAVITMTVGFLFATILFIWMAQRAAACRTLLWRRGRACCCRAVCGR